MNHNEIDYAVARVTNEIEGWCMHLEYWQTANGGEQDSAQVALCEAKLAELNADLDELLEQA